MKEDNLTHENLKSILNYDANTGMFKWLISPSIGTRKGYLAGSLSHDGYIHIVIRSKSYLAHRLAWFYTHGEWPPKQIDHINRVRDDNRLLNLRLADSYLNAQNQGLRKCNTSGVKGVGIHKTTKKWRATIHHNNKRIHIGLYDNLQDAKLAREIAEIFCWRNV